MSLNVTLLQSRCYTHKSILQLILCRVQQLYSVSDRNAKLDRILLKGSVERLATFCLTKNHYPKKIIFEHFCALLFENFELQAHRTKAIQGRLSDVKMHYSIGIDW